MKNFFAKLLAMVGGKRGISVVASAVVTGLTAAGKISPQTATAIGTVAAAVGLVGIGHNFGKADADPDSSLAAASGVPATQGARPSA